MTEKFRFDPSFHGYNKKQVDEYINGLLFRYDELKTRYEEILRQKNNADSERDKIARIFIKAQEKADSIVAEAEREAVLKKKKIEEEINAGKAVLDRTKNELSGFRNRMMSLLDNFDGSVKPVLRGLDTDHEKIDGDFKINDDFEAI